MADSHPKRMVDEEALSTGWSLVDDEGEVESISSEGSSSADFLLDSSSVSNKSLLLTSEAVHVVPVQDDHAIEISNADVSSTTIVDETESDVDADIVHIDDATDDNLDDWVTTELENRRLARSGRSDSYTEAVLQQNRSATARRPLDNDASSECSAGSDDESSAGESIAQLEPEDLLPAPSEELPSDYPERYRKSSRAYAHQRNNDTNKSLTIVLFAVLTIVAAIAFGHFRGTHVALTRHSPNVAGFEPEASSGSTNILSDIQKDQVEILTQLQRMLKIQVELKQRISGLEDENRDLKTRLLESRKWYTRILHRVPTVSTLPVQIANNTQSHRATPIFDHYGAPIFDFHPQPSKREAIALPLSLSAVVHAQAAAKVIRTNFKPVTTKSGEADGLPVFNYRKYAANMEKSVFPPIVEDRFMRIPKEQVDFVMIEDVVMPLERLLGSRKQAFRPVPEKRNEPTRIEVEPSSQQHQPKPRMVSQSEQQSATDEILDRSAVKKELLRGKKWAYSERLPRRAPSPAERVQNTTQHPRSSGRTLTRQDEVRKARADAKSTPEPTGRSTEAVWSARGKSRDGIRGNLAPAAEASNIIHGRISEYTKEQLDAVEKELSRRKSRLSDDIKAKIVNVKAEIRREKDRAKNSRKIFNDSAAPERDDAKSLRGEKAHKYASSNSCKGEKKSSGGYCYLKSNKYRNPEKMTKCTSPFWRSLPSFVKKHFGRTEKLEKVFRGLGTDIVRSKVFRKVIEEVPKKFKASSEWLDCQWKWWQSFARRERQSPHGDCSHYLNSWQHKHGSNVDRDIPRDPVKTKHETKIVLSERRGKEENGFRQEAWLVPSNGRTDMNESNWNWLFQRASDRADLRTKMSPASQCAGNLTSWFFQRASDRAEFRKKMVDAGRQMGNLTSWFFQRARGRDLQRSRSVRDEDDEHSASSSLTAEDYPRRSKIPSDPIYEFLKHRASWYRSGP